MDFKEFPKIERLTNINMIITQKLHGTNAQIVIYDETQEDGSVLRKLKTGSRSRWITPEDDNFGFARFVYEHKQEFIDKLGPGTHFGEWVGLGINSGEGLKDKQLALFDPGRYKIDEVTGLRNLPPQTTVVPILHYGAFDLATLKLVMESLKTNGSVFCPGFMRPEGVVVQVLGKRFKAVFDAEETAWKKPGSKAPKVERLVVDYGYLLQPIRLEKLLSKDEAYTRDYPKSLGAVVKAYTNDLIDEGQIKGDADEIKAICKGAARQIFAFIKETMESSRENT